MLAVALAASGCHADLQLLVDVRPGGSGVVRVGLGLDDEAAAALPDLGEQLWVDDLEAAGWRVLEPALEVDGRVWVRASHPFADADEATAVLDQVSGPDGPFGDLAVGYDPGVLRSRTTLSGTVDLRAGLEAFADEALRDLLGSASPLASDVLEQRLGRPLDDVLTVEVVGLLPGRVRGGDGGGTADAAVWRLEPGEQRAISATGRRWHPAPVAWAVLAAAAACALVGLLVHRARSAAGAPLTPSQRTSRQAAGSTR